VKPANKAVCIIARPIVLTLYHSLKEKNSLPALGVVDMAQRGYLKVKRNKPQDHKPPSRQCRKEVLIMQNFYKCESDLCLTTNGRALKVDANRDIAIALAAIVALCLIALTAAAIAKS
jgi:hypothetical protein